MIALFIYLLFIVLLIDTVHAAGRDRRSRGLRTTSANVPSPQPASTTRKRKATRSSTKKRKKQSNQSTGSSGGSGEEEEVVKGDKDFLEWLETNNFLTCYHSHLFGDWIPILDDLNNLVRTASLFILYYRRGGFSSGIGRGSYVLKLLRGIPAFRVFIETIEMRYDINNAWILAYVNGGSHPWHRDRGYKGTHRLILSLGCRDKWMWFKLGRGRGRKRVGFKVPHATVLILSKKGGGVTMPELKHMVNGDGCGWIFAMELSKRKN